jgi:hypothetical protein
LFGARNTFSLAKDPIDQALKGFHHGEAVSLKAAATLPSSRHEDATRGQLSSDLGVMRRVTDNGDILPSGTHEIREFYSLLYLAIPTVVRDAGELIKEVPDPMSRY